MQDKQLKISIVTPVFNGAGTIAKCIESVQSQDYGNTEHIVIDGCSTDDTIDIVKGYGTDFISEPDTGVYDAFNKGVRNSSGDIIHILNADDFYATNSSVSKAVTFMQANELDLCHGYAEQFSEDNTKTIRIGQDLSKRQLLKKMRVAHPATFVKREVYRDYGMFSEGFRIAADHDFLLRIWDKVAIGFLPETLVSMKIGGISTSQFVASYRESMAAAILNGMPPTSAYLTYNYEIFKNVLLNISRK